MWLCRRVTTLDDDQCFETESLKYSGHDYETNRLQTKYIFVLFQCQFSIWKAYSKKNEYKDVRPCPCVGCADIPHTFLANGSVNLLASWFTSEVKKKFWSAQEGDASWLISDISSPFVATATTYIWMFSACACWEALIASADPFDVTRIPERTKNSKHLTIYFVNSW